MKLRPLPLSIPLQLGVGAGMPKLRKLRVTSVRITPGTVTEKMIIMGAVILGRICQISILLVGQPIATTACSGFAPAVKLGIP